MLHDKLLKLCKWEQRTDPLRLKMGLLLLLFRDISKQITGATAIRAKGHVTKCNTGVFLIAFWTTMEGYGTEEYDISGFVYTHNTCK